MSDDLPERRVGPDRRGGLAALLALGRRGRDAWRRRALGCAGALAGLALVTLLLRALWPAQFHAAPRTEVRTLHVAGQLRRFRLHYPPRWDPEDPLPLVLVFHGHHGDARTAEYESRLDEAADRARVLVAYPDGTGLLDGVALLGRVGLTWNAGSCCDPATARGVDDVGFADQIVRALGADGSVDRRRVYATGFSIGGTLALRIACDRAALVAAVADVEGTMPDTTCAPARPVPVLLVSGTDDDELRADLRENRDHAAPRFAVSMRAALRFWARHDGCAGPLVRTAGDALGPAVRRDSATGCPPGTDVVRVSVPGNPHAWPGGRKPWVLAPAPAPGVPLDARMLDFFLRHTGP
jgi:polyhydroxybutyrate depolymerase